MTSVVCSACALRISSDADRVYCFGGCGQILHVKCSEINLAAASVMRDHIALKYMCFDCRKKQMSLNDTQAVCGELIKKVDALITAVGEFELKAENVAKKQCDTFELNLLPRIKSCVENAIAAEMANLVDSMTAENANPTSGETYASVTSSVGAKATSNAKRKVIHVSAEDDGGILRSGKRRRMVTVKNSDSENLKIRNMSDTCDTPLSSIKSPKARNDVVSRIEQTVLLKPKISQLIELTKKDISTNLDPVKYEVKNVQYRKNGDVAIVCGSTILAQKLLDASERQLSENYVAEILKPLMPRIKILGVANDVLNDEITEKIKIQNTLPKTANLKLIRVQANSKNNTKAVIIETDALTYNQLMKFKRVNIGWERHKIFEYVDVMRCFQCSQYGHKAANCNNAVCCPKCAEGHPVDQCKANTEKCTNCHTVNEQQKLPLDDQLDVNHASWSVKCPLYLKQLKKSKKKIDYTT